MGNTAAVASPKKGSVLSTQFAFGFSKEKEFFIENLVMLCESGMDIVRALESIEKELRHPRLKDIVKTLLGTISRGEPTWKALEQTQLFRPHVIALIRLGEQSGRLFENLAVIAVQQKKEASFQSKVRSALMYPVFILSVSALVGIGVTWFILPNLARIFFQLNLELPLMTKLLLSFGIFMGQYGLFAAPVMLLAAGAIVYFLFFFKKTKVIGQKLLFHTPGISGVIQQIEIARMSFIMGSLLKAGVPITDALSSLRDTAAFLPYSKLYAHLTDAVERGNSLQKSFASFGNAKALIPTPIQHMIVAGEQSGRLAETFLRISQIFEEKTEDATKNIATIMEPILLLVVWCAVVGLALAVILPIYGLIGGVNK